MKKRNKKLGLFAILAVMILSCMHETTSVLAFNQVKLLSGGINVAEELALTAVEDLPVWDINRDEGVMDALDINGGDATLSFSSRVPEGWYLDSFSLAYRDYENGVTEKMADEAARTLGEDEAIWAVMVANNQYSQNLISGALIQIGFPSKTLMSDNLTNEFYYAIKLTSRTDATNHTWKRGKLSYRRCAKTSGFDDKTMQCQMPVVNGYHTPTLKKTYKYGNTYLEMIAESEIEDWGTEWRRELLNRYGQLAKLLDNTDEYLRKFVGNMQIADTLIDQLDKTKDSVEGIDEITSGLDGRKDQLRALREYYASLQGNGGDDGLEQLRQQNLNLAAENTSLVDQNQELKTQNASLSVQIADLERENDVMVSQVADLEQEKNELSSQVENLTAELEALKKSTDANLMDKITTLESEKSELEAANRALESTNHTLVSDRETLEKDKMALKAEKDILTGRVDDLLAQLATEKQLTSELRSRSNGKSECVTSIVDSVNSPNDTNSSNTVNTGTIETMAVQDVDSVKEESSEGNQEMEVPRLGGSNLNVWLGVALLALALGTLLLWLKRVISR